MFSLPLISSLKQTSSIRLFSPSLSSELFASSSWMKTVHIIGNPLVYLSLKFGWALWVKSGPFLWLEENKGIPVCTMNDVHSVHFALDVGIAVNYGQRWKWNEIFWHKVTHLSFVNGLKPDLVFNLLEDTSITTTSWCFHSWDWHSFTTCSHSFVKQIKYV